MAATQEMRPVKNWAAGKRESRSAVFSMYERRIVAGKEKARPRGDQTIPPAAARKEKSMAQGTAKITRRLAAGATREILPKVARMIGKVMAIATFEKISLV